MRAIVVRTFGEPGVLEVAELPAPEPAAGQVRIKVAAASVNPVDLATRSGALSAFLPELPAYPLGWDVAGTVDAIGDGVADLAPGTEVIGLSDWFATLSGTHAEYVVLPAGAVTAAPAGVAPELAATLPLNGLTALQALDLLDLSAGQTLAVTGAAGAVGGFAVELAARRGITVLGVAGPADRAFVSGAGATPVSRGDDVAGTLRALAPGGVDAVFDTALIGADALAAVRDGGRYVGVFGPAAPGTERGIDVQAVSVHSDAGQLAELVFQVETGALTLRLARTLALADAAEAHTLVAKGGLRGRVVLTP
ncbi:NADPH:quinone reductase [Actinacidiphila rubida]|uniref:NADPH:quinone reductase n=1 Tax=Actinacidiphila rubida TaxID=310780 RepID=A0A1H8KBB5_9ACTN|nr:NADP-dependent oxidoreductase [Actinacidiphila rubida]SEN90214.1 NADPH:quinone reductase [Actinacidiphila rubida]